jgi:hypothetical protein
VHHSAATRIATATDPLCLQKPLSMPLHPFSSAELKAVAIDTFDKVLLYCQVSAAPNGEERGFEIAQAILRAGLEMATLRDEIYCQLIKQATNNKYAVSSMIHHIALNLPIAIACVCARAHALGLSQKIWQQGLGTACLLSWMLLAQRYFAQVPASVFE